MKNNFKKTIHSSILATFIFVQIWLSFGYIENVNALSDSVVTFEELGAPQIIMHGPYGTSEFRFNLPAHWDLQDGAQLQLIISAFYAGEDNTRSDTNSDTFLGAMLDVFFNGKLQQSVPLKSGSDIVYTIPIRFSDLKPTKQNDPYEISFFLDASIDCNYEFHHTTILISPSSLFEYPHQENAIDLDLRSLPYPLYQPGLALEERSGVVLIPTTPSEDELQAALIVMTSLSRMTNQKYPLELVTANQLTNQMLVESDIIAVGMPSNLPILQQFNLPIPPNESIFPASQIQTDDGILQIVPSPWSTDRTVLVVSGNTNVGVLKAAQALSSNNLQTALQSNVSMIAEVRPISINENSAAESALLNSPTISFPELGYEQTETIIGIGQNWFAFDFFIPLGYTPSESAHLDLAFSNSALVDPERSGFSFYMNADLIGSDSFSDSTNAITNTHLEIPLSSLKPGRNRIDIAATLIPRDECSIASFNGLWMSIFPETTLHMPLQAISTTNLTAQFLNSYPHPFTNDPSLTSTLFVLSDKDPNSWKVAGDIAYSLGRYTTGAIISLGAVYTQKDVVNIDENYNLIIVGIPTNLQLIYDMKESMPAYYEKDTNIAVLQDQQIVYRIAQDKDLGYLQLFSPPWNENVTVLAVLGTTSLGVTYAAEALIKQDIVGKLKGDFVTLDGEHETIIDSRSGLGTGLLLPNLGPSVSVTQTTPELTLQSTNEVDTTTQKAILPALIGVIILIIIVVFIAVFLSRRNPGAEQ